MREDHTSNDLFVDDLLRGFGDEPAAGGDLATEIFAVVDAPPPPETPARRVRRKIGRTFMVAGGLMGLFVLLYAVDLIVSAGDVPRGVVVAGVDVGGLSHTDAEAKLRTRLQPRLTQPVLVHGGDITATLVPAQSGLGLDWPATLAQAGHQPLSPITRIESFFRTREVGVVTRSDRPQVDQAVRALADQRLNHPLVEGNIGFQPTSDTGVTPYPVEPRQGQSLVDVPAAVQAVIADWLAPGGVPLRMDVTPPKSTSAGVHALLEQVVTPAVAQPVVVHGQGEDATLTPAAIASSFQFAPRDGGRLELRIDQAKLQKALQPDLAPTETDGRDAQIVFTSGVPSVEPSEDARKINWATTFKPITQVLAKPDGRDLSVVYDATKPSVSTEAVSALGIKEVVGEFTTSGFSGPAATNIQTLAERVSGAIVKPGETFSLGARSGVRSAANGYVSAPVDEDGTGPSVVGGGVSQFASTLYNAAYLAGLGDGGHAAHDHYLDRYPAGRDAAAVDEAGNPVELQITDTAPTGFAIQAHADGGSVTVRIWGTKQYRVEGRTGDRSSPVEPTVQFGPDPDGTCRPSAGAEGFAVSDTRVLYDPATGNEVREETRTTTYAPRPIVLC
ncbi:VanW family protein [Amycolatopsis sp. PS_44_ISF1]|uniref:VanW family protein n=1 Tax=Amycolatopsis sp. PS_44_ISF1 TaxID=2974917 RepID=UPI0028DE4D0C|nr:VanW family protein [Amycolatopsis sp. PS_44_ISF1]MDT8910573.1 VanW family protein [Amycolatopsis sp. PS_44_ISF1]